MDISTQVCLILSVSSGCCHLVSSKAGRLIQSIHKILVEDKLIFFMENGDFWHIFKGKLHVLNVVTLGHQTFFETDFFVLLQEN